MCIVNRAVLIILALATFCFGQDVQSGTLVGLVTDSSGSAVPNAYVKAVDVQTKVESHGLTTADGNYIIPYLNVGEYEITVEAAGFKKFVRLGVLVQTGSTMRIDVRLEVGAVNQEIEVTAANPLLATDSAVIGSTDDAKKVQETPINQSRPTFAMYYMEGAACGSNSGVCMIGGLSSANLNYTVDGAQSKQSVRTVLGEANTMVTVPIDSIAEAQVWSAGIPAETGHTSGGAYNVVTKSGTNELHLAAEERIIMKPWIDRQYFQQSVANLQNAYFEYHNFDATLGGPVVIPKIYNGKNKTFFYLGYRFDYDHESNSSTASTVDQNMLNGNFAFGGIGYPIYDPKTITCTLSGGCPSTAGWTATPFPNSQIPLSRFDPVTAKFLSFNPYQLPNTTGFYSTTGPNNNYTNYTPYLSDRQGHLAKVDEQIGTNDRLFVRYNWNMNRQPAGRPAVQYAWGQIVNSQYSLGLPEKIDVQGATVGEYHNFSPTVVNEFRMSYQRRNDTVRPVLNNGGWASILGIPGVGPQTFPGFVGASGGSSVTWTANPSGTAGSNLRTLNEDFEFIDNVTKVHGKHTFKMGYQGLVTRENDVAVSQPSGVYNFAQSGSGLPFTPNTGDSFASFLLGSVTSATFTTLLADYLPRWWTHQFFVQDDWRILHNLTLNIGLRYDYESPANTKWGLKSEFNPNVVDPLTGLMGAITNPTGTIYKADLHNFDPRIGLSWNFKPKFVFRGSFDRFTVDVMPELGQDNYLATAQVQQVPGNPNPAFYLSQGPGPIVYTINPGTETANYVGTNYSGRTATYIDPNLRNPYVLMWSAGFQWEFMPNHLAEVTYMGDSGVALVPGAVNMNVLPMSIYQSTNQTLLNTVYANSQNYLNYPQFGTINYYSNFGHSTYHSLNTRVERRFGNGLSYTILFTWSKTLSGTAGSGEQFYDWNLTKGPAATDYKYQFTPQATYDLPFGRHRKYLNRAGTGGYILDLFLGGWTFTAIESMRTGLPVTFTMAGSPYKYLPGQTIPNIVAGQAVNVPNYSVGPNLWPESNQNPWFNINAFSYPGAFQNGNAGVGIGRAGGVWWPEYSLAKSWTYRERFKIIVRADAHNDFPKTGAFLSPNSVVNIASPQSFGRFAPATSYGFSSWYTTNPDIQGSLRIQF
jgi:hypothetical protein